jgi:PAS domain S-box-containing protein
MYDALLAAMMVINETGVIQYLNDAAKKLTGYGNLIGRNVKMLMPPEHAMRHDQYLANYMRTGDAKVIGTGRNVAFLTKDGTFIPIHLTVTKSEVGGTVFFVGTLAPAKEEQQTTSLIGMVRDVLNSLSNPSVAITETGTIQVFNDAAQKLFGYDLVDVVGKNVKMLMPPQQAEKHDGYLSNYLKTGEAKIIGTGRDIVIKTKTGELKKQFLTVTERDDGKSHIFTGVFSTQT